MGPASSSGSTYQSAWVPKLVSGSSSADEVDHGVVVETLALVGQHLLGHRHLAEGELDRATRPRPAGDRIVATSAAVGGPELPRSADPFDEDLGLLLRLRVPVAVEGVDEGTTPVQVQLAHLVGAAQVQVDGPGMDRGEGALGLDRAEHLSR